MGDYTETTGGKRHLVDAFTGKPILRWQFRIRSEDPTLIDFTEVHHAPDLPMAELYAIVRRTSYMVTPPNRKVMFSVEVWVPGKNGGGEWKPTEVQGISKLKEGLPAE